jgi:DNA helicase-2/ATP-dependent DNA helicase PcrA
MYVAITRAKTELYISRAHERYTFGNYSANPKSRFIKEIPAEYLEVESNRGSAQSIFGNGGSGFSSFGNMFNNSESSGSSSFSSGHKGPSSMNSFAKAGIKPKNSASSFAMGDRVKHAQYGVGTIVTIDGAIASIAFSGLGIKKMNVEIAPIEKV